MENKILLINWRFSDLNQYKFYSVYNDEYAQIIFSAYNNDDLEQFTSLVNKILNNNKVLILTHTNPPNNISIDLLKTTLNNNSEKLKIRGFEGGFGKVYYSEGKGIILADGNPENDGNTLLYCLQHALVNDNDNDNDTIKKDNFDYVWNYYWDQLELEYQKKKIIDLFLPLFIDIKILNHISAKEKNTAYLNEVKTEYTESYFGKLKKGWKEIKNILAPDQSPEVLEEQFQLTSKEKVLLSSSQLEEFSNIQSVSALSEWFPQVVDMLNTKIDQDQSHIA